MCGVVRPAHRVVGYSGVGIGSWRDDGGSCMRMEEEVRVRAGRPKSTGVVLKAFA